MLGKKAVYTLISQYYPLGTTTRDILLSHSEDVANLSLEIARAHPEIEAHKDFLWEAAMLHDIGIFRTNAPGIACYGEAPYILHGYIGAELLRSHGLHAHAHIAERHTGSGLTPEEILSRGIDLPIDGIYTPITVEERIICYADKFYSKTHLGLKLSLEKVRTKMQRHGDAALERFDELHQAFALNKQF